MNLIINIKLLERVKHMKKDINYVVIDGRGDHQTFKDCLTMAIKELKPEEGIHLIKDFEPSPIYKMMEEKGFDKYVEKVNDSEFHVYFSPKTELEKIKMGEYMEFDEEKIQKIMNIKLDFLKGNITLEEAKNRMKSDVKVVNAKEFAVCEQYLEKYGISDDELAKRMGEILQIFDGILEGGKVSLPLGHPIRTYSEEIAAIRNLLQKMREMLGKKYIKNQWLDLYDELSKISIHFSRKENQLFSYLEKKGFDKPSKVMWTLDNEVKDTIKRAHEYLSEDKEDEFLKLQGEVIDVVEDMMVKEEEILLPTAMDLLSEEDFISMRAGDDEIGYCLIETPPPYGNSDKIKEEENYPKDDLLMDLSKLLQKHGIVAAVPEKQELDVSQGKLTLEQINLIFKHLKVDLSYVDENELVKFYSDTVHRVFPRSPGVIGRKVQNCHPRESVSTVEEIIRAFRAGEQEEAEFWLEMGGKFIYIIYTAVRDDKGNFKGVLEMMQDATKIRSLTGSKRLLSWTNEAEKSRVEEAKDSSFKNEFGITKDTIIGDLVKQYPFIKEFLFNLSPKFSKLKNPILFKTMGSIATLEMISERGGFKIEEFLQRIIEEIRAKNK